jgi:hypothetical protein
MNKVIDYEIVNVNSLLKPGESIVWQGFEQKQPIKRKLTGLNISLAAVFIFALCMFGLFLVNAFKFFFGFGVLTLGMYVVGIFVTLKMYSIAHPNKKIFSSSSRKEQTYYVLTNKRAIVYVNSEKPKITDYVLSDMDFIKVSYTEYNEDSKEDFTEDNIGSITFGSKYFIPVEFKGIKGLAVNMGSPKYLPDDTGSPQIVFENIKNVDEVYGMIKDILIR